ncbi:MAG TPA: ATP-binding protein, partial [Phytomonospora sp.]
MERAPGARVGNGTHDGRWFDPHDAARHSHAWRTPIPWPARIGVLPAEARCHQHRAASAPLDQPRDWSRRTATTGPVHLVTGESGVGKTQLVAHYVRTLWAAGDVDLLIWITAASREAVLSAYSEAAELADRGSSALPGAEARAKHFLDWARDTHKRWIVVFDDLADPAHLEGLWPTGNPNGRVITTATRAPALPEPAITIELEGFGEVEAYEFLATSLLHEPELLDGADRLAEDLDRLPLALGQAAAYIRDQGITCADYRKRLANADLAHGVVGATSELSAELADDLVPDSIARMLRHLLAYLDGRGFPAAVCVQPVVLHHLGRFAGRPVSTQDVTGALDRLHRLGLVTCDADFVQIAGPTREAAFARIPAEAHWTVAHVVAEALATAWPQDDRDDALTRSLRDNATGLRDRAGEMLWTPDCHLLLLRLGDSLGAAGFAGAATVHFGEMARLALRHLGPDHPRTLASRYRHANWSGEAGSPTAAAEG